MRSKGKLKSWDDERGFGFVVPMTGGEQVFIHIKAFGNRSRRPVAGQIVTYELSSDEQGRPRAIKAALSGDKLPVTQRGQGSSSTFAAVCFLVIVGVAVLADKIPSHILGLYIAASLITFFTYAADKLAARDGAWRTQESTLHLLSLVGGWPGALVAQQRFRHKTSKRPFRFVFWITVFLNCLAFAWLFTQEGSAALKSLVGTAS